MAVTLAATTLTAIDGGGPPGPVKKTVATRLAAKPLPVILTNGSATLTPVKLSTEKAAACTVKVAEALAFVETVIVLLPAVAAVNVKLSVMLPASGLLTAMLVIPCIFENVTFASPAPDRFSPPCELTAMLTLPVAGNVLVSPVPVER